MYKQGRVLGTVEARDIAASGGVAWCVLVEFGNPDKSYNGPVTFSPCDDSGYYVEVLDGSSDEAMEDAISDMLSSVIDGCDGFKVTLTDFDPEDFVGRNVIFEDFGEGTFCLYQAIEK